MDFDYIVVGGGSGGCVLAARLSEDPSVAVALVEAGPADRNVLIHVPAGLALIAQTQAAHWTFSPVPQKGLNGRLGYQPRGKTLGGSSSINGMLYVRGHRTDYDHWAELGNSGWSYDDVLPIFKRSENNEEFHNEYHGQGGVLNVTYPRFDSPLSKMYLDAVAQCGIAPNPDYNGAVQEGSFLYQVTQINGERCSAAKAYLTPHLNRPNLKVITHAVSSRIEFDGRRATGVAITRGNQPTTVRARREVVVSAGAFGSPQLLQLSGIGDADELHRHGMASVHHLPGVGKNLQDHIDYVESWFVPNDTATFGLSFSGTARMLSAVQEWRKKRTGMITSTYASAGAFLRSCPKVPAPDLQLTLILAIVDNHGRKVHAGHGIASHVDVLRPYSRGTVTLQSQDPRVGPLIDPGFLSDERDFELLLKGARLQRRIMESSALDAVRGKPLHPVPIDDVKALEHDIRNRADTQYHPVGTCKMGPDSDPMAVLDAQLRVRGVQNLRVADASIMPTIVGGNTNAPSIMIGEKCADMIRASRLA